MVTTQKPYKGLAMEGPIATWYTKNTGRDLHRFTKVARAVTNRVAPGGRVLEVAPGPGFCAIEIARSGQYSVTGLDISESFVRIARENATKAGVVVDFRHGNASAMPFSDSSFDFVVCSAAFKNFSNSIGALDEIHRIPKPGGQASITTCAATSRDRSRWEVRNMRLSAINALLTLTFRFVLLRRYTRDAPREACPEGFEPENSRRMASPRAAAPEAGPD